MIDRRKFGLLAALGLVSAPFSRGQAAEGDAGHGSEAPAHDMSMVPPEWKGDEQIVFLGYQGMTALDLIGPQYMMASLWGATVKIAAKTMEPLRTDTGVVILPDQVFAEVQADLDVICVPGSVSGSLDSIDDEETVSFLADRGSRARYVTSVCTGTLLLGQAGLVDGYRVTSHWLTRPLMAEFGAIPVDERVVRDRNRITGGGVTAGIDFGLTMLAEMQEPAYAEATQLLAEYAPAPPFDAGTPATAPAEATDMMTAMFAGFPDRVRALAAKRRR